MSDRIQKVNIKDYFSPYFIRIWRCEPDIELKVDYVQPEQFLVSNRIDLICKLFYIECREKRADMTFAKELYTEHLRAFSEGTFTEPGNEEKNTIEKYFSTFDRLIDDIKKNGFDVSKSVIPISDNGVILDGSHRVAAAIYFNIELPVVRIHGFEPCYNSDFFLKNGLKRIYLDFMVDGYICRKEQTYIVCLWPAGYDEEKNKMTDSIIRESVHVVYQKKIRFNYNGIKQLVTQVYHHQSWTGSLDNGFSGVDGKARPCYAKNYPTTVYVIEGITQSEIVELKNKIRDIYQIENHSIHITDTKDEAIEAAELLLNENSIHLANYGYPLKYWSSLKDLVTNGTNNGQALDIALTLYGICDRQPEIYKKSDKIIDNPKKYLWFFGNKVAALNVIQKDYPQYNNQIQNLLSQNKLGTIAETVVVKKPKKKPRKSLVSVIEKNSYGQRLVNKFRNIRYAEKTVVQKDIQDIQAIFESISADCGYLIMRNWEGFYDDILIEGHNDIDLLCANKRSRDMIVSAFTAKKLTSDGFHYSFIYRGIEVTLDTRIVGDGYYDINWQRSMLKNRVKNPLGFYVMSDEDYFYSLAYHAIYQKKAGLSEEYRERLGKMKPEYKDFQQEDYIKALDEYMLSHGYFYTHTVDDSVVRCFNRVPDRGYVKTVSIYNEIM